MYNNSHITHTFSLVMCNLQAISDCQICRILYEFSFPLLNCALFPINGQQGINASAPTGTASKGPPLRIEGRPFLLP